MIQSVHKADPQNRTQIACLSPFISTGKERDEETGYNYHGARYYDANLMTGWLSVDPMSDKHPNVSSYTYCYWNPIKLIDPDGCDSIVLMPKNKRSKYDDMWIRSSDRDNTISVHTHGKYDDKKKKFTGIMISDNSPKGFHYGGVKEVVSEIQNSPVYKEAQKKGERCYVTLYICYAAKGKKSFAQQVSEQLPGIVIIAPTGTVGITKPHKNWLTRKSSYRYEINDGDKISIRNTYNAWQVIEQGAVIDSFSPKSSTPNNYIEEHPL